MPDCDNNCGGCGVANCGDRVQNQNVVLKPNAYSSISHVIGVVSGKGGVGKSLVCSMLANEMQRRGFRVGILDADITGPSIPKAYGIKGDLTADENGVNPRETHNGIKVISTNLMLPKEDAPVAWRGPVVSGVIRQFFNEVNWGEIDYLFVDMPPGTSDVALTVFQSLPLEGIVVVSTPQDLVSMIVGKAVNLAQDMDVEVLGLVENMAYFVCDSCDKKHYLFGDPQAEDVAERYGIAAHASIGLDPKLAQKVDAGKIYEYETDAALEPIIKRIEELK
ncbi:MAG: Mrp/NBP35 family ATP-binding protein [Raoultibacter sp.]|jgi:Mrp family chromosome partitioning ATPase